MPGYEQKRKWTAREDAVIQQHWQQRISAVTTAGLLGVSERLIRNRRRELGLKR